MSGFYFKSVHVHLCSGTTILLTSYRDKDDALNYIAAGGMHVILLYVYVHHSSVIVAIDRCNWRYV